MNPNAPALKIPNRNKVSEVHEVNYEGITIRDYIAIEAMKGYLSKYKIDGSMSRIAIDAYLMADALIAESNKKHE